MANKIFDDYNRKLRTQIGLLSQLNSANTRELELRKKMSEDVEKKILDDIRKRHVAKTRYRR